MRYVGSKNRLAKDLLKFIQPEIKEVYIEAFVGGANLIDKIKAPIKIGIDNNKYLIAMWQALQQGWLPPLEISESEYYSVRDNFNLYPDYYIGLVGFCATFGSKWFGGYGRGFKNDKITPRNDSNEAIRNILKQVPNILDIEFICCDYAEYNYPENAVIYCDPPYSNTTKFKAPFDSNKFWDWCRSIKNTSTLFISEYWAPDDFIPIWSKQYFTQLPKDYPKGRVENLYIPKREKNL
jgi:DNA adenine methylase